MTAPLSDMPAAGAAGEPGSPDMPPPSPDAVRRQFDQLAHRRDLLAEQLERQQQELGRLSDYLAISDQVSVALEQLSESLFAQIVGVLKEKLTIALQEVLEQPLELGAECDFKRGSATISFHVERDGEREDIMRGQGGSVVNVLSVGLRMFALATLDPADHRRFLVLDEQDCWLRPDLVPRLVKIIHDAGRALGFQVLLISHHDVSAFERFADRIFRLIPSESGVRIQEWSASPDTPADSPPAAPESSGP